MKRLPAKPLNESSMYVASSRDKRSHSIIVRNDPNDTRSDIDLILSRDKSYTFRNLQTEAWIRGEEYPMPWNVSMPEEGDILNPEFNIEFPNDDARKYHAENSNV